MSSPELANIFQCKMILKERKYFSVKKCSWAKLKKYFRKKIAEIE